MVLTSVPLATWRFQSGDVRSSFSLASFTTALNSAPSPSSLTVLSLPPRATLTPHVQPNASGVAARRESNLPSKRSRHTRPTLRAPLLAARMTTVHAALDRRARPPPCAPRLQQISRPALSVTQPRQDCSCDASRKRDRRPLMASSTATAAGKPSCEGSARGTLSPATAAAFSDAVARAAHLPE